MMQIQEQPSQVERLEGGRKGQRLNLKRVDNKNAWSLICYFSLPPKKRQRI
jgi:hypothetical protein